jgi:hypothetical protein
VGQKGPNAIFAILALRRLNLSNGWAGNVVDSAQTSHLGPFTMINVNIAHWGAFVDFHLGTSVTPVENGRFRPLSAPYK